ncbi:MAG: hypothetical protein KC418_11380 [Anaerolineales bacterium]|nr:hypothetical protein [Anaerolineales bacterium]MCB8950796.1 hypothetical protein [Ardenticatenales bacterium]
MRRMGLSLLGLLLLVACGQAAPPPDASIAAPPAISPEFTAFYADYGGLRTFGYPLTGTFVDPDSGRVVQYFQNLRLELASGDGQVEVTPLGSWALRELGTQDDGADAPAAPFRDFYEQYGGATLFGAPLSTQREEGGRWVQYFRNARLEWHPEEPPDLNVQVAQLGQVHFLRSGAVYTYYQQRRIQDFIPDDLAGIQEVTLSTSIRYPILFAGDEQHLIVTVRTPDGYAVPDALLRVTIRYEDGSTHIVTMPPADRAGISETTVLLDDWQPGRTVHLQVQAESVTGRVLGKHGLSFKTWW